MRLGIMSDLHLEFHADEGLWFVEKYLDPLDVDVLVLAGDIVSFGVDAADMLRRFAQRYPKVVYIPGNHDFYGHSTKTRLQVLEKAATKAGVEFLYNRSLTIDGKLFVGGTMWFRPPAPYAASHKHQYRDFKAIQDFEPWVYEQNAECLQVLERDMAPNCVVVTHFMPFEESVHPRYKGERSNAFFVCEVDRDLVETRKPDLWIHGHTHEQCDYFIGKTRVVCNPLGYPHEGHAQMAFNPRLIVEV